MWPPTARQIAMPRYCIASTNIIVVVAVEGGLAIYALHRVVDMRTAPQSAQITNGKRISANPTRRVFR
jgi:hypothetical protein